MTPQQPRAQPPPALPPRVVVQTRSASGATTSTGACSERAHAQSASRPQYRALAEPAAWSRGDEQHVTHSGMKRRLAASARMQYHSARSVSRVVVSLPGRADTGTCTGTDTATASAPSRLVGVAVCNASAAGGASGPAATLWLAGDADGGLLVPAAVAPPLASAPPPGIGDADDTMPVPAALLLAAAVADCIGGWGPGGCCSAGADCAEKLLLLLELLLLELLLLELLLKCDAPPMTPYVRESAAVCSVAAWRRAAFLALMIAGPSGSWRKEYTQRGGLEPVGAAASAAACCCCPGRAPIFTAQML